MRQVAKNDSSFAVMTKFTSANIPLYRTATVYLRLAEAINRMGYPDAAFAILKDGINDDLTSYVVVGDSTDIEAGRYIRPETIKMLHHHSLPLRREHRELRGQLGHPQPWYLLYPRLLLALSVGHHRGS